MAKPQVLYAIVTRNALSGHIVRVRENLGRQLDEHGSLVVVMGCEMAGHAIANIPGTGMTKNLAIPVNALAMLDHEIEV